MMRRSAACLCIALCVIPLGAGPALGLEAAEETRGIEFFESRIRPVLSEHCYECHSAKSGRSEGGLRLDSRESIRAGGDRGPSVIPGDSHRSLLLAAASHTHAELKMPYERPRLPDSVLDDLRQWINMGAPDPRDGPTSSGLKGLTDPARAGEFWAFRRPVEPPLPDVGGSDWPRRDLDAFVLSALKATDLSPSPDAMPQVLLRRLHFDLIGLPPSPTAIDQFARAVEQHGLEPALASAVDALLASPQFGERWGRHWLDVARFAESSGTEANISFPYAWRYRDYVIDCINADMPFDRFLIEQIAGDLLSCDTLAERARLLVATGFLAVGPKNLDAAEPAQFEADVVDEQIDTVTRAILANSVACARCHDHKFDPFTMEDYYALAGMFASTSTYFGTAVSPVNRVAGDPLRLPPVRGQLIFHASIDPKRVEKLKTELAALKAEQERGMAAVRRSLFTGKDPGETFTIRDALRIFWRIGAIEGELEKVDDSGRALPLAMGALDRAEIRDVPLLERGEINRPGQTIARRFPEAIPLDGAPPIPSDQSGRLELALWLTHPDHPLTSRVLVNRVWHHLLGAGLVRTVDNFGTTGEAPSHPELLDHLAVRFIRNGWSIKQLVREIVLSRTYRQSSEYDSHAFNRDPENRLLWRFSRRRLPAEAIRDSMLVVSGELDQARPAGSLVATVIGDRPIALIGLDKRLPADLDGSTHRSVYLPVIRDRLPDVLELFDFAEPSLVTGNRETTNVPVQALYLMNSPFVLDRARGLARRLLHEAQTDEQRIRRAFLLCFGRLPDSQELRLALGFVHETEPSVTAGDEALPASLVSLCQGLLAAAEFRNLD
jgi:hypothetical protein